MRRHIMGALAATVAAPSLVMFFMTWVDLFVQGDGQPIWGRGGFVNIIPFGILALFSLWLPLLVLACISLPLGLVLERVGCRSRLPFVICGSLVGLGFTIFFIGWSGLDVRFVKEDLVLLTGLPSGAICGWIYWRIAIGIPTEPQTERVEPPLL